MTLEIPSNKLYSQSQTLSFLTNNIFCLIGGNGSGKSTILESTFKKYIELDSTNVICFSSGQNELFYSIFDEHKRKNKRYMKEENKKISSFYFNYSWVRILIFFATALKREGKVRQYLLEKNYIDINEYKDDISTHLKFRLRVTSDYSNRIKREIEKEETEEFDSEQKLLRKTIYHNMLIKLIEGLYDPAPDIEDGESIRLQKFVLRAEKVIDIMDKDVDKIFTFLAHAVHGSRPNITLKECKLFFKNNLEFEQLSDGEYQLLSIYALIDLFDTPDTLFLFDEIDSHLHFANINKLWDTLQSISGKLISTTHISESILKNKFDDLLYVHQGKIETGMTALEALQKISNVANNNNFIYNACHRIEHIALMDDESDWEIFKQLAIIKVGEEASAILNKVVPIKETSSYSYEAQLFGNEKIEFVKKLKNYQPIHLDSKLKNIFMICDKDEYNPTSINSNLMCKITDALREPINEIKEFSNTKSYLLSWQRREILHYLLSYTMVEHYGKIDDFKQIISYLSDAHKNQNFDNDQNIKTTSKANVKFIKNLMLKENGADTDPNWTDFDKLREVVSKIPANEISEDIVKMFDFIKEKVESNA